MATRSTISIKTEGGKYETIYCHWDGYPEHNGKILLEHYQDEEKIKKLIALGSISILAPNVEPTDKTVHVTREWDDDHNIIEVEHPGVPHTFDKPHKDVVVAYGRDRGEDYLSTRSKIYDKKKYIKGEEYDYLFEDGVWKVRSNKIFVKLTENMCK